MNAPVSSPEAEPRQCLPPRPPYRAERRLPAGACDTHFHVFGAPSAYPLDPARGYTPSPVTLDDYRAVMAAYGIERAVAVQPSVYGFDNGALFDALAVMPQVLRGVAVIAPDAPAALFARAHSLGVRGVRINPRNPAGLTMRDLEALAERIQQHGWHIQFQLQIAEFDDLAAIAAAAGRPPVIDHLGFPDLAKGPGAPAFGQLVELAAAGACHVKLSAPYRLTGSPDRYALLAPFVEKLVDRAPDALLWGLDWPHTECFETAPDDGPILDLVWGWLPGEELRRKVLVDNPARLYWGGQMADQSSGHMA